MYKTVIGRSGHTRGDNNEMDTTHQSYINDYSQQLHKKQELEKAQRNAKYLAMLDESVQQYADGRIVIKTIEELENMAK